MLSFENNVFSICDCLKESCFPRAIRSIQFKIELFVNIVCERSLSTYETRYFSWISSWILILFTCLFTILNLNRRSGNSMIREDWFKVNAHVKLNTQLGKHSFLNHSRYVNNYCMRYFEVFSVFSQLLRFVQIRLNSGY